MFDLVMDIEKYPEFLPWCLGAKLLEKGQGDEIVVAELEIGFKALRETFTSRVEFERPNEIRVLYQNGPFKYLHNKWKFTGETTGCIVSFQIDFEFRSLLLKAVMQPLFHEAVRRMVNAFENRASELYDARGK